MAGKLAEKTAIITGASGGIGRALCERFSAEGARVVLAGRNVEEMTRSAALITGQGGRALVCRCDVTNPASAREVVEKAVSEYGSLDILINNAAAFTATTPFDLLSEEDWETTVSVNLTGTFHMSKPAVAAMKGSGGGVIIHVSSQLARVAAPGQAAYCMSKAALVHLAKAMAVDLAGLQYPGQQSVPGGHRRIPSGTALRRRPNAPSKRWGPRLHAALGHCGGGGPECRVPGQRRCLLHDRRGLAGGRRLHRLVG